MCVKEPNSSEWTNLRISCAEECRVYVHAGETRLLLFVLQEKGFGRWHSHLDITLCSFPKTDTEVKDQELVDILVELLEANE